MTTPTPRTGSHRLADQDRRDDPRSRAPSRPGGGRAATAPGLSIEETALLLGLPVERAAGLRAGEAFTGPCGLRCRLAVDEADGIVRALRPVVMLGLRANELQGDEVEVLLRLQGTLLAGGLWLVGVSDDGELQLTHLSGFDTPHDAAAALQLANVTAWVALRALLDAISEAAPSPAREDVA